MAFAGSLAHADEGPKDNAQPTPSKVKKLEPSTVSEPTLEMLQRVRKSVVRLVWRDTRHPEVITRRNAVAIDSEDLLLMAGPPPQATAGVVTATTSSGTSRRAKVVASDANTALSLVRVPRHGLPPVSLSLTDGAILGSSGERVALVNTEGAVAFGALRSWGRRATVRQQGIPILSTALLEAGLSTVGSDVGSPLVNAKGKVVGLFFAHRVEASARRGESARRAGLIPRHEVVASYAVPSATASVVWPLLRDRRRVARASLGRGIHAVIAPEEVREQLCGGCPSYVITRVIPRGRLGDGALKINDLIVALGSKKLPINASLDDVLLGYRPGDKVRLTVLRSGSPHEVVIHLSEKLTSRVQIQGGATVRQQARKQSSASSKKTSAPESAPASDVVK